MAKTERVYASIGDVKRIIATNHVNAFHHTEIRVQRPSWVWATLVTLTALLSLTAFGLAIWETLRPTQ